MSNIHLLRLAEQNALAMSPQLALASGGAGSSVTDNSSSGFSYTGGGRNPKQKGKGKFFARKKGIATLLLTLSILVGGGFMLGSTNTLLVGSLSENISTALDPMKADNNSVLNIISYSMRHANNKNFKLSEEFKNRLTANGVEIETSGDNIKFKFGDEIIDGDNLSKVYKDNVNFRDAFDQSRLSKITNYFDKASSATLAKFGISRNRHANFTQTADAAADMEAYNKSISSEFDGNSSTLNGIIDHEETRTVYDENEKAVIDPETGEPMTETVTVTENENLGDQRTNQSMADATVSARSMIGELSLKAANVSDGYCAMMRIGSAISNMVAATNTMQAIKYFSQMESVSKAKVDGEGDHSAINEFLNLITTPVTTLINALDKVETGKKNQNTEIEVTAAPIQANGLQSQLGNAPLNPLTTQRFSITRLAGPIAVALGMSRAKVQACAGIQAGRAVISIATTIATLGVSTIGQIVLNYGLAVATGTVAATLLSFAIPTIAQALGTNVFETAKGLAAGELLAMGGVVFFMTIARNGSGFSFTSAKNALAANRLTQETIALEAEVDRKNRSPFDITSENTFLGSIVDKLATTSLAVSGNSIVNLAGASSFLRVTTSSLASIMTNNAIADGEGSSYTTSFGKCPELEEIGAVGDMYCVALTDIDADLVGISQDDPTYKSVVETNLTCDENGNCQVKEKSNLAKYIAYCDMRESPPGIVDQNILGAEEYNNFLINAIPIVGDIMDLLNSGKELDKDNLDWSTGLKCVNNPDQDFNPDWTTEYRYYQRYVADSRIKEHITGTPNAVSLFVEEYQRNNPITGPVNQLARMSGLTESYTESVLAWVQYQNYIADYDPTTRLDMDGTASDPKTSETAIATIESAHLNFDDTENSNQEAIIAINQPYILYDDVRNRNFAAC